jgi:hypothetical protein
MERDAPATAVAAAQVIDIDIGWGVCGQRTLNAAAWKSVTSSL